MKKSDLFRIHGYTGFLLYSITAAGYFLDETGKQSINHHWE